MLLSHTLELQAEEETCMDVSMNAAINEQTTY